MKIIRPVTVNDSTFVSSNITEDDYPVWSSTTTYNTGDRVIVTTGTHKIYESAIDSNLNNDPTVSEDDYSAWSPTTTYAAGDRVEFFGDIYESLLSSNTGNSPDASSQEFWQLLTGDTSIWIEVSATNRWKAFDSVLNEQATRSETITYSISPSALTNSIAFFNLEAATINVTVTDSVDGEVYNEDYSLVDNGAVDNWYAYFFEPIIRRSEFVSFDLPNYATATIAITIDNGTSDAKVGQIVLGAQKALGVTTYGTSIGIQDYSRKERDTFGNAEILERRFAQTVDYDIQLATSSVRDVQKTLATYRATPLVYSGTDDGNYGDLVFGYYRNFGINISGPALSDATIEVEGLV